MPQASVQIGVAVPRVQRVAFDEVQLQAAPVRGGVVVRDEVGLRFEQRNRRPRGDRRDRGAHQSAGERLLEPAVDVGLGDAFATLDP